MERIIQLRETFQITEIANFHSTFRNYVILHRKERNWDFSNVKFPQCFIKIICPFLYWFISLRVCSFLSLFIQMLVKRNMSDREIGLRRVETRQKGIAQFNQRNKFYLICITFVGLVLMIMNELPAGNTKPPFTKEELVTVAKYNAKACEISWKSFPLFVK